ncbi:hypothetical protein QZH41_009543, partial [Actinostola sp. cb2023]
RAQSGIPEGAATLAFVFDTTGSMYDDLVQVRAGASKILSESLKQRVKPLYNYAIVPFHDPDVGPATITTDAKLFQRHLDDLYVQGGGDCPEMSISAIMLALEISLPGSFIYVFTDAQAKDMHLTEKVLRLVQLKQSQVNFVLTGDCHNKTIDPEFSTYKLISAASTGQGYRLIERQRRQTHHQGPGWKNRYYGNGASETAVFEVSGFSNFAVIRVHGLLDPGTVDKAQLLDLQGKVFREIAFVPRPDDQYIFDWIDFESPSGLFYIRLVGVDPKGNVFHRCSPTAISAILPEAPKTKTADVREVLHGSTVTLSCRIESVVPCKSHWIKGSLSVSRVVTRMGIFNTTYTILSANKNDEGLYTCYASNVGGVGKAFTTLYVKVPRPIFIEKDEVQLTVKSGDTIVLRCATDTKHPATITWYKDGQRFQDSAHARQRANGTLFLDIKGRLDAGRYRCIAKSDVGQIARTTILNVNGVLDGTVHISVLSSIPVPPTVYIDHDDVIVREGDSVTLECRAYAQPTPTIQWYKGRYAVVPSRRIATSSRGHLVINAVQQSDTGFYTCVALNIAGSDSVRVSFSVQVPPRVTVEKTNVFIFPGGSTSVQCLAVGIPPPVVIWYKNNKSLDPGGRVHANDAGELVVTNAVPNDAGNYTCIARSVGGSTSVIVQVAVGAAPYILTPPDGKAVTLGESVTFHCDVQGVPVPKVFWRNNLGFPIDKDPRYSVPSKGTLHIQNVEVKDAGKYVCIAENDFGRIEASAVLMLIGLSAPTILKDVRHIITGISGHDIEIACSAQGTPTPVITWAREGYPISTQDPKYKVKSSGSLVIKTLSELDTGVYTCTAVNTAGADSHTFAVFIQVPPIINTPPRDVVVDANDVITLECGVIGFPPPDIRWQLNNVTLPYNRTIITIREASVHNSGIYRCIASNTAGTVTADAVVNVKGPPSIVHEDIDTFTADPGENITLPCKALGYPKPVISWLKNGDLLVFGHGKYRQEPSGTLRVSGLEPQDTGTYTCQATNQNGFDTVNLTVIVTESPTIVKPPQNMSVVEGKTLKLECVTKGFPLPRITWTHNGKVLPYNHSKLEIKNIVKRKHEGNYTCTAGNLAGRIIVGSIVKILSREPPTESPTDDTSAQGSRPGSPTPVITWLRNGEEFRPNYPDRFTILANNSLQITNVKPEDEGTYRCHATSDPLVSAVQAILTIRDGEQTVFSRITGHINDVMLPKVTLKANLTRRPTNITELSCNIEGLPDPIRNWFKYAVPITAPIYWAGSSGQPGAKNGLERTRGLFNFSTRIGYPNGEVLSIDHTGRGLNEYGVMVMDINIRGHTPKFPPKTKVSFNDYKDMFVQTGNGHVSSIGKRYFTVDDKTLEYLCNNTVEYKPTQAPESFSQTLEVMDVDVNEKPGAIGINMKTFIKKSPFPQECPQGLVKDVKGEFCEDMNECLFKDTCQHICENGFGTFRCLCRSGFYLQNDNKYCKDVDECSLPTTTCPADHYCVNAPGTYSCRRDCDKGYARSANGNCEDVNECKAFSTKPKSQDPCTHTCVNSIGSFKCSCKNGYELKNGKCEDIDECVKEICFGGCNNLDGDFECFCFTGYKAKTKTMCEDVDECQENSTICGSMQCTNTAGSYIVVYSRVKQDTREQCMANVKIKTSVETEAILVSLTSFVFGCPQKPALWSAVCLQPIGYSCSCYKGYRIHNNRQGCVDVNECLSNQTNTCQFECVNTLGGYKCRCPNGYRLSTDGKRCEDVDECVFNPEICRHENGRCMNTHGSYRCVKTDCPANYNALGPGYCLQPCSSGFCIPQALRYYTVKLSLGVPANQDLLHLIPYYPSYLQAGLLICDFKYYFPDNSTPFGIRQIGNQAVIFTIKPLVHPGMHQLEVKADIKYADGSLACVTDFTVYIDVAKYLF